MCRQVKSIEIIEFGYEKSDEGVNGAKSEYCVDKHKLSMTRPVPGGAARGDGQPQRRRRAARAARALAGGAAERCKWKPGETDDEYKARVAQPYETFKERAVAVRDALAEHAAKPAEAAPPPAKAPGQGATPSRAAGRRQGRD